MLDLIKSRKSVRMFSKKEISDKDLRKILEAGRLAPSWMNVQPWKFILVKLQENKNLLSKLAMSQPHVKNANALIVCVADEAAWKQAGITDLKNSVLNPALQGADGILLKTMEQMGYAIAYMTLEAQFLGIGSCIIGGVGNELTGAEKEIYKQVKQKLNLGKSQILSTIIALGYEEKPIKVRKLRKSFGDVVFLEKIGSKF